MSDTQSLNEIWQLVLQTIKRQQNYSDNLLGLWFREIELVLLTEETAVIVNKRDFKRDILISKYKPVIEQAFETVLGFPVSVDIRSSESQNIEPGMKSHMVAAGSPDQITEKDVPVSPSSAEEEPNFYSTVGESKVVNYASVYKAYKYEYTFDTFIVGSSNKFAHAACTAVANNPAREYNPLFIYGPSGLGKTHLLYAITDQISKQDPDSNIIYVKGEEFTNQLIDCIRRGNTAQFRDLYRKTDVLLIDDIQFIAGKDSIQEEFFHTFNDLYENRKQIIMTSDRPPKDIKTLEDRLKSRFEWGLIADIQPPDFELRTAILKNKASSLNIDIPDDVLAYIAENLRNNVRQLEGAVRKIGAQSFLIGKPINIDLAINCISDMLTGSEPVSVTVDKILDKTSKHYGVTTEQLKSKKRTGDISLARHVAVYIIRQLTDMSLPAIGKVFQRDHTTIMNSLDAVESKIKANPSFEIEINDLIKEIKS